MKPVYIELKGEKHPLCYNLYAAEEISEQFGSLDQWQTEIEGEHQIRALSKTLKILMEAGRAYAKEMGMELPQRIENPAALIDITSPDAVLAIFNAIRTDTERTVETKNAEPTQER